MIVDTNVLVDVLEDDPQWAPWSVHQLRVQSKVHRLAVNAVIYSELSLAFEKIEELDAALARLAMDVLDIPRPALFLAAKAFLMYRRRGGARGSVLPDFYIGAHAAVAGVPILTRDVSRYASYFPGVPLVTPGSAPA